MDISLQLPFEYTHTSQNVASVAIIATIKCQ